MCQHSDPARSMITTQPCHAKCGGYRSAARGRVPGKWLDMYTRVQDTTVRAVPGEAEGMDHNLLVLALRTEQQQKHISEIEIETRTGAATDTVV